MSGKCALGRSICATMRPSVLERGDAHDPHERGPPMTAYLEPTQESGRAFVKRAVKDEVVMLNLLRFRDVADYSATPGLAPEKPISGAEAYDRYIAHTMPYLIASGGELLFLGQGGAFLIGPEAERWNRVMLVRQRSVAAFMAFATNQAYLAGIGHRI